jgi:hypothetical protein
VQAQRPREPKFQVSSVFESICVRITEIEVREIFKISLEQIWELQKAKTFENTLKDFGLISSLFISKKFFLGNRAVKTFKEIQGI